MFRSRSVLSVATTGDSHQQTSSGLSFYRKRTNTPTFTNGSEHWALTRDGLVTWTGSSWRLCTAAEWLDDSFEVAEVHVHPRYQRRGIGRRLLFRLTGGRAERTAVLSTMDTNSPARRLYRSLGFTDLLTGYRFSGAPVPYAVMGAALPLPAARS